MGDPFDGRKSQRLYAQGSQLIRLRMVAAARRVARLSTWLAWLTFAAGFIWRWVHIFYLHDPRDFLFSDMAMYVELARRIAQPGYQLVVSDLTHPPALVTAFAWALTRDPTMHSMVYLQFVFCVLVPLAVGGLGWAAFDSSSGKLALAASSLYFPFVDYGGYFLSEIPFVLTLAAGSALFLWAARQTTKAPKVAIGVLSGIAFSLAMSTKVLAFPALGCLLFAYVVAWRGSKKGRALVVLSLLVGLAPITTWQVARCTTVNHGHVCLGTTKGASDILLGHHGRFLLMFWHDPETGRSVSFGSPSAAQHGYSGQIDVDFAITDNASNMKAAKEWISSHPREAFFLSLEHIYDLFFGSIPWPSASNAWWVWAAGGHYIFVCLLLFPSVVRLLDIFRAGGARELIRSTEVLLLAPVLGLIATAAIGTGEPRYRIPFDVFFIVVAMQFFRSLVGRARGDAGDQMPPKAATNASSSSLEIRSVTATSS